MKWYAIRNPKGEWVEDAASTEADQAWEYAFDVENDLHSHPEMTKDEVGEAAGYRCVEVELVEPRTADSLKRARLAWDALVAIDAKVDCDRNNAAVRDIAVATLGEVLGRVTDNAASEGREGENP